MSTRTIRDPFLSKDVQISNRLTDRLRGKYANGPTMPNGEPEFGWRQFETPPIQHEAAARIEMLETSAREAESTFEFIRIKLVECLDEPERSAFWKAVESRDKLRSVISARVGPTGDRS